MSPARAEGEAPSQATRASLASAPRGAHGSSRDDPSVFALAPCTLGEDQPNADLPEGKSRQAVADQIGPLLLVLHATHPGDIEIRFRKKSPLG